MPAAGDSMDRNSGSSPAGTDRLSRLLQDQASTLEAIRRRIDAFEAEVAAAIAQHHRRGPPAVPENLRITV